MLKHSNDSQPGFTRQKKGRSWAYFDENGDRVTDREVIDRLNAIGLPPAYGDAWFCKDPAGHLQATGIDARGRKQYRYHADFRKRAEKKKFDTLVDFGASLPKLRKQLKTDLAKRTLCREAVLAAIVHLLDTQYLRIGNARYAKENKSFGATTLQRRHIKTTGRKLMMRFKGKHGKLREVTVTDRRLGRIVRKCQELPGQSLFQYVNGSAEPNPISSADVNDYIRAVTGGEFTAKHFRTWGASVIAFEQLIEAAEEARKISVKSVVEPVAEALGNTVAISRKSYVHPALLDAVKDRPRDPLDGMQRPRERKWHSASEVGLLAYLERSSGKRRKPRSG